MSRRVYLHVGAPKTGTTYLQDRLALNRASLASHGVHYPIGLHASHFRPALDLIDLPWAGEREDVHGEWDGLMARVRRHSGNVIVSHEILAAAKTSQIKRAMEDLGVSEVHLVYSARDIARQVPAEWQEGLKHRRTRSFSRFLTQVQAERRHKPDMWFWRVQSLPDVLSRWSRGLPPEQVHVVTVPQPGAPRLELWHRYCTALAIDPAWAPEESARENNSIGTAEAAMLRQLNRQLKQRGLDPDQYGRLVRELMVHQTLAHRPTVQKATIPPAAYPWAQEVAEEWIEWVTGSGVNVVGDLEDLRPAPLPEGRWKNPDNPPRKQVLDAAIEALAAMTMETASRPDANEQISAKIGRAARRLRGQ